MKYLLLLAVMLSGCDGINLTDRDLGDKFDMICIDGHVYYQKVVPLMAMMSIKLDDDGKPIKCGVTK